MCVTVFWKTDHLHTFIIGLVADILPIFFCIVSYNNGLYYNIVIL